jgi:hypothetical protein
VRIGNLSQNSPPAFDRIKDGLMLGLSMLGLERNLLSLLDNIAPDDVYRAIEADKPWIIPQNALQFARPIYKKFHLTFLQYTPEYILEKLRKKRPELYSVIITHPDGRLWVERRLTEVKKQLEGLTI